MNDSEGPPPAGVRDDLTILGLCAMYECSEPAEVAKRRQPDDLGGIVIDVPLCGPHVAVLNEELGR